MHATQDKRQSFTGLGLVLILAAVILPLLGYFLWKIPEWYYVDYWALNSKPEDILKLQNDLRTILVQAVGGAALLVGLLFTWRNLKITQETAERNLKTTLEGQITERFTQAVELLGSADPAMRLGGIYALERIAKDSKRDYWPIMEILTAYLRDKARISIDKVNEPVPDTVVEMRKEINKPSPDIQAILSVLARRPREYETGGERLELTSTDLRRSNLRGAHLENTELLGAHLAWSFLNGAHLEGAELYQANLQQALLEDANFEGADLSEAHLEKTSLVRVNLKGTTLHYTNLRGADLSSAIGLTQKQIEWAILDAETKLPSDLTNSSQTKV